MTWRWSYIVWTAWIALFLLLELPGLWRLAPWVTLSETAQHVEHTYPIVRAALFGFLSGLLVHIVFDVKFSRAMMAGLLFSFAAHYARHDWP
jgi:hypothetical protein